MPTIYTLDYTGSEINALLAKIRRTNVVLNDTTYNWNLQPQLRAEEGTIYVYRDYHHLEDDVGNITFIPDIKIGDGQSYLIDLPFISDYTLHYLMEHINDTNIHVSEIEKQFWNNKVAATMSTVSDEKLILYNSQNPPVV